MSVPDTQLSEQVEAALRRVEDPRMEMNVFEAGLVEAIDVDDGDVTVEVALSEFGPEAGTGVTRAVLAAVSDVDGVDGAHVEPASTPSMDEPVGMEEVDTVIAVASTKGGVGKSTVATQLACALAGETDAALFDADVYGPNVPSMLGVDGPIRADADDRAVPVTAGPLQVMSVGLMTEGEGPLAWRGAMVHDALTELFETTAWDDPDVAVVDLPPGTGDVALTTLQEVPVDGVVFVTTPFHTSVEDTRRSLDLFEENGVPVLGAVVNMDHFACDCGREHDLFPRGDIAEALDVPILAELPFSHDLQRQPTPGDAPEAFVDLAHEVREAVAEYDRIDVPDDAVDLRGQPPERRFDLVREAFEARDPDEPFHVVSDRDPAPAGEFLVELVGEAGDPDDVFAEFAVQRHGVDQWVLRAVHR